MKQRIILATDSLEPSGVGEHMLTLGTRLAPDYDIILAAPEHSEGMSLLRRGADHGLAIKTLELQRPELVRHWLVQSSGALLHVHAGIGWEGHDLARLGKAAGLTVVRTEHLPYLLTDPIQRAAYRAMLLNVDGRIAVSQSVHDTFKDHGRSRLTVIYNGIKHSAAVRSRESVRRELGLADGTKLLLTVARLSPQKGHSTLVEAAPVVVERFPDTVFLLVGTGSEADAISAQIARVDQDGKIQLLGARQDVGDLLAASDLFILPSLFEGLPLALLEAVAAQVPVVATTAAGSVEVVGRQHPFLASPNDPESLAAAIVAALSDPDLSSAAAVAAHQRFTQRFAATRMADETARFYQSILHKRDTQGLPR